MIHSHHVHLVKKGAASWRRPMSSYSARELSCAVPMRRVGDEARGPSGTASRGAAPSPRKIPPSG